MGMSYSKKYRERTIEYRQAGHSLEETHQIFKVSKSTIQKWEKQLKETRDLAKMSIQKEHVPNIVCVINKILTGTLLAIFVLSWITFKNGAGPSRLTFLSWTCRKITTLATTLM